MAAQYYYAIISNNPDDHFKLDNIESIRNFLIKFPKINALFHTDLTGIKIQYNINTGEVELFSRENQPDINNLFSKSAFEKKIKDVEEAICGFAKYEMLRLLSELNDPDIIIIIKKNKLQFDDLAYMSSSAVNRALEEIKNFIIPIKESILAIGIRLFSPSEPNQVRTKNASAHYAIYLAFDECGVYEHGINHIKSIDSVNKIMETIKINMLENTASKPTSPSSPSSP